jgi:hypothetical protein
LYSTCLFCNGSLGRNEAVEHFPVGRRLAFDAVKGRLWVVCARCQRWNLTPLEERWEAIEECERMFRAAPLRAQTSNIGLVKLREGTELVRIGPALRPEFAAWRYGRTFAARFRRRLLAVGGGTAVAGAGALVAGAPLVGAIVAFPPILFMAAHLVVVPVLATWGRLATTRVIGADGKLLRVTQADLEHTELRGDGVDSWALSLRHSYGRQELTGDVAKRALGSLLASANRGGAPSGTVGDATKIVSQAGAAEAVVRLVRDEAKRRSGNFKERWKAYERGDWLKEPFKQASTPIDWRQKVSLWESVSLMTASASSPPSNPGAIPRLPASQRLALEMALHESSEQAALEGELGPLAEAWREAEEIAAIADDLLTPRSTTEFLDRHKPR